MAKPSGVGCSITSSSEKNLFFEARYATTSFLDAMRLPNCNVSTCALRGVNNEPISVVSLSPCDDRLLSIKILVILSYLIKYTHIICARYKYFNVTVLIYLFVNWNNKNMNKFISYYSSSLIFLLLW